MTINLTLAPGDVLEIDSDLGVLRLNGIEVYDLSGNFFDLAPGANTLEYSDSETGRNLQFEIEFTERYV